MSPYPLTILKSGSVNAIDTYAEWGIVCKEIPYQLYPETKELPSNDWADNDGDDTYIPGQLKYKGYDLTIEWVYKGEYDETNKRWSANVKIKDFIDFLSGKKDNKVSMTITDTYTQVKVSGVYFKKAEEDAIYRMKGNEEVVTFKTTMRVTNPIITNITD